MSFLLLLLLCAYLLFLMCCVYAWKTGKTEDPAIKPEIALSVVICARNEEDTIGDLLKTLINQSYKAEEIIVVDDGSSDRTSEIVGSFSEIKLLKTNGVGKKQALKAGIAAATQDNIVCTDADCQVPATWLQAVASYFEKYNPSLLIMPVKMSFNSSVWQKLQALEFLSLAAVTAGSALMNRPMMCNGANLAFKKEVWLKAFDDICLDEPSGDDMFFLISCKKRKENIMFVKSPKAMVVIQPNASLTQFCNQRSRWYSKSKSYRDIGIIALGIITLCAVFAPVVLLLLGNWQAALLYWSIKTVADICFLSHFVSFFNAQKLMSLSVALAIVYPFYVGHIALSGAFRKVRWK